MTDFLLSSHMYDTTCAVYVVHTLPKLGANSDGEKWDRRPGFYDSAFTWIIYVVAQELWIVRRSFPI